MRREITRAILASLPDGLVLAIARCGPFGQWGRVPGTNGSVIGVLLYVGLFHPAPIWAQLGMGALLVGLAIAMCGEAERRLQKRDPGEIILDEVAAQPLVFIGLPDFIEGRWWSIGVLLLGFLLFRLFDIVKPFGIRELQRLHGGRGIVVDDVAAALAAAAVLQGCLWSAHYAGWIVASR